MHKQLTTAITLCALAGSFSQAQAQVMCGDVITTSEVLTSDLLCTMDNPALTIQGPGGRLDMNNFTVSCGGSGAVGIALTGTGAVLQNGTVSDCGDDGVTLNGSNHRLLNEMLVENTFDGVSIRSGSGHQIRQTTSRNNEDDGFEVSGDGNNQFDRNRATGNDDDAFEIFSSANGNTLTRNVATGGNDEGYVISSDNNLLTQNVAQNSSEDGIDVGGSGNTITRSNVRNNIGDGIEVELGALNNTLSRNVASGNGGGDTDNDGGFDLEDDNADCDANAWTNNRGTRNQLCIQ